MKIEGNQWEPEVRSWCPLRGDRCLSEGTLRDFCIQVILRGHLRNAAKTLPATPGSTFQLNLPESCELRRGAIQHQNLVHTRNGMGRIGTANRRHQQTVPLRRTRYRGRADMPSYAFVCHYAIYAVYAFYAFRMLSYVFICFRMNFYAEMS